MTLEAMAGIAKLATERERERSNFEEFVQQALDLFERNADGLFERDLVRELKERGATGSIASACADELVAGGVALKDWRTGLLTHVR